MRRLIAVTLIYTLGVCAGIVIEHHHRPAEQPWTVECPHSAIHQGHLIICK